MLLEGQGIYLDAADDNGSQDGMTGGDKSQENGGESDDKDGKSSGDGDKKSSDSDEDKKGKGDEINDETAKLLKDVMKWKDRAKNTENANSELSKTLDKINSVLGDEYSIEDIEKIISDKKASEVKELEKKGEYDRIVQTMKEENDKKISTIESKNSETQVKLDEALQQLDKLTVGRAFSDSKFIKENSVLPASIARNEFGDHFEHEDGKIVAYDKPKGAKERTPLVDSQGNNKSFEDAIAHLYNSHPEKDNLLRSKRKPGSSSKTREAGKPAERHLKGVDKISKGLDSLNN